MRLLIAEDDRMTADTLGKRLRGEHYAVDVCYDGLEAWDCLRSAAYDVAVLDIMMPGLDGMALVQRMRAAGMLTPVLLLTARDAVVDKVSGLDHGADDYMTKPFAIEELLARIRVALKKRSAAKKERYVRGKLTVDLGSVTATYDGHKIDLTKREFDLLVYLLDNMNVVVTREQVVDAVWGYDFYGNTNVVDVYIRYLRAKIDDEYHVQLIETVRGSGYVIRS